MRPAHARDILVAVAAVAATLSLVLAPRALATNAYTQAGNRTAGCAVDWYAGSDLSMSRRIVVDGTVTPANEYSNQGYLFEVSSHSAYPAVNGPGDLLLHHWFNPNSPSNPTSALGFRLPVATDHTMYGVTVTIHAQGGNFALVHNLTSLGLAKYVAIDGNPKYTIQAPLPTVGSAANGDIVLTWAVLPAGSADIYGFTGTVTDGSTWTDPANHYLIEATLTARYAEGGGCAVTEPVAQSLPVEGECRQVLGGRTLRPLGAADITERRKTGDGGEVNADGWTIGSTPYFRLYGATDRDQTDVTFTATAAQGMTFRVPAAGDPPIAVVTGSPTGMGALPGNGYTVAATGVGQPAVSADGRTITLTVAHMPAHSAVAFTVAALTDGSLQQMVIDETMVGRLTSCITARPISTVTGICGTANDVVTPAVGPDFTGTFDGWTAGTVTYMATGTVFGLDGRTATTYVERVVEIDRTACPEPARSVESTTTTLGVRKAGPAHVHAGGLAAYRITVSNRGGAAATAVALQDRIPRGFSVVRVSVPYRMVRGTLVADLGSLAPGGTRVVTILLRLDRHAVGWRTNVALVGAGNAPTVRAALRLPVARVAAIRETPPVAG